MRALLALAAVLLPSQTAPATLPAVKPTVLIAPVDRAARDKFPNVAGKLIDDLAFINLVVNSAITYQDDKSHYGIDDFWVMAPSDAKGDCEDYALTKPLLIMRLDDIANDPVDPVSAIKLVGVVVHYKENGKSKEDGHAILALRLPDHSVMYLDSNFPEPMTRAELVAQGYQFFDWKA